MKTQVLVAVTLLGTLLGGCVTKQSQLGVQNKWRAEPAPVFERGRTTRADVLHLLGPPSQVIGLRDQTLFYYLREQQKINGLITVVYNRTREQITYDRAIFFFNTNDVLTDFALSDEAVRRQ